MRTSEDPVDHETHRSERHLLRDERGVIMVVGVFITLMLIGLTWFIFGIGNAIAYREQLQNASDAAAFAAAVSDAQGMNLLAMINIVMALVAITLFVAKIVEVVKVFSDLSTCQTAIKALETCIESVVCDIPVTLIPIATATGITCVAECADISSWQGKLKTFDKYEHYALASLHDAEVGVAVVYPWIGAGESGNMEAYYTHGVPVTTSFSYSQIPWSAETHVGSLLGNLSSPSAGGGSDPAPAGTRYGLPVTSDTDQDLCRVMYWDISTIGGLVPSNPISSVIGDVLQVTSQWFCDDGEGGLVTDPGSSAMTAAIEGAPFVTDFEASAFCAVENTLTSPQKLISFVGNPGGSLGSMVGGALNLITPLPMSTNSLGNPASDYTNMGTNVFGGVKPGDIHYSPMMIYPKAKMGLDYFGVWSTAIGNYGTDPHASRVQIAGQQARTGNKVVIGPPQDVSVGVSKSEFYYDPGPGDTSTNEVSVASGITTDPSHDVLWNMRWRARLRRYHYFPGALGEGDQFLDLAGQGFSTLMSKVGASLEGGASPSSILGSLYTPEVDVNSYSNKPTVTIFH
jgi:hypothetical protein